ncbi:MAG TPA: 2-C-methyl-D-erythritol 4-phosphate cytidylyltransferase [Dehalococcoidia bacterium]|nr:2-C-methyl-D-erythritol 4-phosphate cytidylyltransferase [Dehalococcoidia bacterium]
MGDVGAVIVAAGRSQRMGGVDKLFAPLAGRPLLAHTLQALHDTPCIDRVVVAANERNIEAIGQLVRASGFARVAAVVPGGARRQDSVRAGLEALAGVELVAVHDGARPLVTPDLVARVVEAARAAGAAVCAIPVRDTVKEVDQAEVVRTLDRGRLWLAQTPQAFRFDLLLEAHRAFDGEATDDAAMVEALGHPVRVVEGDPHNVKVTTPEDLRLLESLIRLREGM